MKGNVPSNYLDELFQMGAVPYPVYGFVRAYAVSKNKVGLNSEPMMLWALSIKMN